MLLLLSWLLHVAYVLPRLYLLLLLHCLWHHVLWHLLCLLGWSLWYLLAKALWALVLLLLLHV